MPDLLEYLSPYIQEQAQRFLTDPEYEQNRAYRDFHLDWLRAHLGPEALGHWRTSAASRPWPGRPNSMRSSAPPWPQAFVWGA